MIGQKTLFTQLQNDLKTPKTTIIYGTERSGKTLIATAVVKELDYTVVQLTERPAKIQEIKSIIETAYKCADKTAFIISDVDKLSTQAQNSLLKIIEEPPKNVLFVLTAVNLLAVLDTIRSRAKLYAMEQYTTAELTEYITKNLTVSLATCNTLCEVCYTPGQINRFVKFFDNVDDGTADFMRYVNTVIDNIAKVSGANAFKIADRINLKDDTSKFDLVFFWRAFVYLCYQRAVEDISSSESKKCLSAATYTASRIPLLNNSSFNKQMLFDEWILEVRSIWN